MPKLTESRAHSKYPALHHQQGLHHGHQSRHPMLCGSDGYKSANISIAFRLSTDISLMIRLEIGQDSDFISFFVDPVASGMPFFEAFLA
ncbi:MAG: hypothetical protein OXG94_03725 [Bacteroidetes bacterium]|nr:hypothetical protein [Bacteroidota bacterium]